ncbi:Anaphase-promoting complex subunit CDC26 [Penicillium taxi]|uniref:Anaphase-promoting complex subunit CDC26 n=1 Tax=Penicillium taxi TaxID=168475 RepID=UPI0025455045|nr:Anaphase-promoting complex subunit CDC26 [Penicillium taxi]KAJ5902431.1 Anaphase-promoting complex subunit CDC26 [Penicillium taxi]
MLRQKPTAIAVTTEDISAFEEARIRKLNEDKNKHPEQNRGSSNVNFDPNDELKPLPGDKARIVRSREERIGIGRRN